MKRKMEMKKRRNAERRKGKLEEGKKKDFLLPRE